MIIFVYNLRCPVAPNKKPTYVTALYPTLDNCNTQDMVLLLGSNNEVVYKQGSKHWENKQIDLNKQSQEQIANVKKLQSQSSRKQIQNKKNEEYEKKSETLDQQISVVQKEFDLLHHNYQIKYQEFLISEIHNEVL